MDAGARVCMCVCAYTDLEGQESSKGLVGICPILQMGKTEAKAGGLSGNKGARGQHFKALALSATSPTPEAP